jgi:hypothetical protein
VVPVAAWLLLLVLVMGLSALGCRSANEPNDPVAMEGTEHASASSTGKRSSNTANPKAPNVDCVALMAFSHEVQTTMNGAPTGKSLAVMDDDARTRALQQFSEHRARLEQAELAISHEPLRRIEAELRSLSKAHAELVQHRADAVGDEDRSKLGKNSEERVRLHENMSATLAQLARFCPVNVTTP